MKFGAQLNFCRAQWDEMEAYIQTEVYEEASQELLDLLGFKVWFGIGHRGDFNAERISRDTPIIGELKP